MKIHRWLVILILLCSYPTFAEESSTPIEATAPDAAAAGEEAPISADVPVS